MKYGKYEFDDIQGGISQFQDLLESMCVAKKMSKVLPIADYSLNLCRLYCE